MTCPAEIFAKKRKPNEMERNPIEIVSNNTLATNSANTVVCMDNKLKLCL